MRGVLACARRAPRGAHGRNTPRCTTVPVESFTGEDIEIGFNPAFVTDVLKVVDTDQVSIEMKASNKPGTLRTGSDFLYVVMPISLG